MRYIPKRKWKYPIAHERYYTKMLLQYVKSIFKAYRLTEERVNVVVGYNHIKYDENDVTDDIIKSIQDAIQSDDIMRGKISGVFGMVDNYNRGEFEQVLKSMQINAFGAERWYNEYSRQWIDENLALIKSIREDTLRRIQSELREAVSSTLERGVQTKLLANRIRDLSGVTEKRAKLIARDQVGKLNGRLTEYRQRGAGIKEYRWSTSNDSRVREAHAEREGQIFKWDKPPYDGHPGQPINCRCVALPVIDFKHLAEQGFYQPRANRAAVAQAMRQWGIPTGALYTQVVGAEPVPEDLKNKPFANTNEAFTYFENEYGFKNTDKFKQFESESLTIALEQLRKLDNQFNLIKTFEDLRDFRWIDKKKGKLKKAIAAIGSGGSWEFKELNIFFNDKYFGMKLEEFIKIKQHGIDTKFYVPVDSKNVKIATMTHEYGHIIHNHWLRNHIDYEALEPAVNNFDVYKYKTNDGAKRALERLYYKFTEKLLYDQMRLIYYKAKEFAKEDGSRDIGMSRYGHKNSFEFFAEAFANSQLSSNPTPAGKAMLWWLKKEGYLKNDD